MKRYTVRDPDENLLGEGGMGRVYRATDTVLGREVALKRARTPEGEGRLRREAEVLARLSSPHIPSLLDCGSDEDGFFVVLPLLDGETLGALLDRDGAVGLDAWFGAVAQALAEAHGKGLVHRDVKPANVFVGRHGGAWLIDWGLSGPTHENGSSVREALTQEGSRLGTPAYMSPEQATGQALTGASDVWSLGIVGVESTTGHRVHSGSERPAEVLARVVAGPPEIPAGADPRLRACLHREPGERAAAAALIALPRRAPPARIAALVGFAGASLLAVTLGLALVGPSWWTPTPSTPQDVLPMPPSAAELVGRGSVPLREIWAAESLARGGDDALRALLIRDQPRPRLTLDREVPSGQIGGDLRRDGKMIVCADQDRTRAYTVSADGLEPRWTIDLETHMIRFVGTRSLALLAGSGREVVLVDARTGALEMKLEAAPGAQVAHSLADDVVFGRLSGGWAVYREGVREEVPEPPCEATTLWVDADGTPLAGCAHTIVAFEGGVWTERVSQPSAAAPPWIRFELTSGRSMLITDAHLGLRYYDGERRTLTSLETASSELGPWLFSETHGRQLFTGPVGLPRSAWLEVPRASAHRAILDGTHLVTFADGRVSVWELPALAPAYDAGLAVRDIRVTDQLVGALRIDGGLRVWRDERLALEAEGVRRFDLLGERVAWITSDAVFAAERDGEAREVVKTRCRDLAWMSDQTLLCASVEPGPARIDVTSGAIDTVGNRVGSSWYFAAGREGVGVAIEWSGAAQVVREGEATVPRTAWRDPGIKALSMSRDGTKVVLASRGELQVRDSTGGEVLWRSPRGDHGRLRPVWSPSGRWVADPDIKGRLHLLEVGGNSRFVVPIAEEGTLAVAFESDRRLWLSGRSGRVRAVDLEPLTAPRERLVSEVRAAWGTR